MPQWGREVAVKFIGGEFRVRLSADKAQDEYVRDLNGIVERSRNMEPAMKAVGFYLMGSIRRTFKAEGRPSKWPALKPATIADRQRQGFGPGPILQRTGKLKHSLTQPGARGNIFDVGPRSMRLGTRMRYFRTHEHGDSGRNIPQRAMTVLQRQDKSQIGRILNTYIRTGEVNYRRQL